MATETQTNPYTLTLTTAEAKIVTRAWAIVAALMCGSPEAAAIFMVKIESDLENANSVTSKMSTLSSEVFEGFGE